MIRGDGRGDLFVTVHVITPVVRDERSKEILTGTGKFTPGESREGRNGLWRSDLERKK